MSVSCRNAPIRITQSICWSIRSLVRLPTLVMTCRSGFERAWPCSFQHPTLRDVAKWLNEESGLEFTVPAASYADKPIPHFTHSGTGYQLLASLGRAFSINDYIWYQLPDGGVFVGSAADALFAGKSVEIPSEFSQGTAAGNTMTVPVIQTLRPVV